MSTKLDVIVKALWDIVYANEMLQTLLAILQEIWFENAVLFPISVFLCEMIKKYVCWFFKDIEFVIYFHGYLVLWIIDSSFQILFHSNHSFSDTAH